MTSDSYAPFSPPGMKFQPRHAVETGPAFSKPFKALACVLVFGCLLWFWLLYSRGLLTFSSTPGSWFFAGGGLGLMLYTLVHILTSQTSLSALSIEQTWIWNKRIEIRDLAYARLIRIKGLEWLIAPRFYTRSLAGKIMVVYVSSPSLWTELERLANELTELRRPK